jgi:hypothetical protein
MIFGNNGLSGICCALRCNRNNTHTTCAQFVQDDGHASVHRFQQHFVDTHHTKIFTICSKTVD